MDLRSELLKSIWYGFTALDLEKSGKVSKSQLKVSEGSSTWKMELEKLFFFLPENLLISYRLPSFPTSFPTSLHFISCGLGVKEVKAILATKQIKSPGLLLLLCVCVSGNNGVQRLILLIRKHHHH